MNDEKKTPRNRSVSLDERTDRYLRYRAAESRISVSAVIRILVAEAERSERSAVPA